MEGGRTQSDNEEQTTPAGEHAEAQGEVRPAPHIYVASLSDYNAGRLHGVWLDATQEPEELHDAITGMLASSTEPHAEEWAIHDCEGFNGLELGEWENLGYVSRIAKGIQEHGLAFAHWTMSAASDEDLDKFEESYLGKWRSVAHYAEDILDDLGLYDLVERSVPENLRPYVTLDASGFGRDLVLGGDIVAFEATGEEGGVYVFTNRW